MLVNSIFSFPTMLSTLSKTIFYVFGHIFCVICKYCQLGPVQNVVTCTGFGYTAFHRLYPQVPIQTDRRENVDNHDDYNSNNDDDMVVLLSMMSMMGIFFSKMFLIPETLSNARTLLASTLAPVRPTFPVNWIFK